VTGQHVQLVVVDGREAVVLERLSARNAIPLDGRSGGRLPVHATSGGVAILAHGHDELLDEVARGPMAAISPDTISTEHALRSAVAAVRTRGYAELRGAITPGLTSVAAPVLRRGGAAVAAVSVITCDPSTRELLPALMTTALGIGRTLQR
jgi:DNA-binding IclR family transcriptional regulator